MRRPLLLLSVLCALAAGLLVAPSATAAGASISGTATYAGGDLTDLSVQLYRRSTTGAFVPAASRSVGQDGTWRLSELQPGTYRVELREDNSDSLPAFWGGTSLETSTDVVVTAGSQVSGIDVAVELGGRLAGVAQNAGGTALPAVQVTLYERQQDAWVPVVRRSTGTLRSFSFARLRPGTYRIGADPTPSWERHAQPPVFWPSAASLAGARDLVVTAGQQDLDLIVQLPSHQPVRSSAPTQVTGEPQVGEVVSVAEGTLPAGTQVVSRQWFSSTQEDIFVPITGAETDRLELAEGLVGAEVLLKTRVRLAGFDDTVHWSWPVRVERGQFTQRPVVALPARVQTGDTLRAVASGAWSPQPTTVSYRWFLDDDVIAGEVGPVLRVPVDRAGSTVRVEVTASAASRTSTVSSPTRTIAARVQRVLRQPSVGARAAASAVVDSTGVWSPGGPVTYQWYLDGKAVPQGHKHAMPLRLTDAGKRVQVRVSVWAEGYASSSILTKPITVLGALFRSVSAPMIKGTAKPGTTVRASMRTWSPRPSRVTYQWYASGKVIKGATKSRLKIAKKLVGKKLTVRVVGARAYHQTETRASRAVTVRKR